MTIIACASGAGFLALEANNERRSRAETEGLDFTPLHPFHLRIIFRARTSYSGGFWESLQICENKTIETLWLESKARRNRE